MADQIALPSRPSVTVSLPNGLPGIISDAVNSRNDRAAKLHSRLECPPIFAEPATFVTFLVGPVEDPIKFFVHKEFACYHSPVLHAAFNSTFVEGHTLTYRLEDTTSRAFRLLVQWLYSQKLSIFQLAEDYQFQEGAPNTSESSEDESLVELWVLANKLAIPKLQNAAIDSMEQIRLISQVIPLAVLLYTYKNTAPDSLLRHYVMATCALANSNQLSKFSQMLPKELFVELACFFRDQLKGVKDRKIVIERYHVSKAD